MRTLTVHKGILPTFTLTEVCQKDELGFVARKIPATSIVAPCVYYYRHIHRHVVSGKGRDSYSYNLMPVVLNKNGVPWEAATIYILSRLEGVTAPLMATYSGIADDLVVFLRFLEEGNIDFDVFPQRKLHRPTYRYGSDLKLRLQAGEIAATTARRRMGTVIRFYRWLLNEGLVKPEHAPWNQSDRYFQFKDARGFSISKKIITTDVAIKVAAQADPYSGTIDDGGKLRPLPRQEQEWLVDALLSLHNYEMTLIHLMGLLTGARMQTILTLRVRHVRLELPDDLTELRFRIGPGTGVDTKADKNMTLFIPVWFYKKLSIYSFSERAKIRRERAVGGDNEDQYLFLSVQGAPHYQSKADKLIFDADNQLRHSKAGQGVRQFIKERLIPYVCNKNNLKKFRYRFHDTRATFCMNLTDRQLSEVQAGKLTLHQAREFVKARMGHESSVTTDLYLNYRQNISHIRTVNTQHEDHLRQLTEQAMEGLL